MKRKISAKMRAKTKAMRAAMTECHDCTDYATEYHHITPVALGGTDDDDNLMPLCKACHKEYTREQHIEHDPMFIEIGCDEDGTPYVDAKTKGWKPERVL